MTALQALMVPPPRAAGPAAATLVMSERGGFLVVEDDRLTAADLAEALRDAGARVVGSAPSVAAALGLIAGSGPLGGAMLDVDLRGETVFPVADELVRRGVPFLFVTSHDASAIPERFAHVTRCEKPVDSNRVVPLLLA